MNGSGIIHLFTYNRMIVIKKEYIWFFYIYIPMSKANFSQKMLIMQKPKYTCSHQEMKPESFVTINKC